MIECMHTSPAWLYVRNIMCANYIDRCHAMTKIVKNGNHKESGPRFISPSYKVGVRFFFPGDGVAYGGPLELKTS